jgi:Uma2 family endonuclease
MTLLVDAPTLITGEELAEMSLDGSYELVQGRIVAMSPAGFTHGKIEGRFYQALAQFADEHGLGQVAVGEVGVYTQRNPDTVRGADVVYISHERYQQVTSGSFLDVAPEIIVEVMSPSNTWSEVTQKLREYFAAGVDLVWVADPEVNIVYAYRSLTDVREFTEEDDLPGDDILPDFSVPVASLFDV